MQVDLSQLICHTLDLSTSSSCLESFVSLAWWPVAPIPNPNRYDMVWNGIVSYGLVVPPHQCPFVVPVAEVQAAVAAGAYGNNHFARAMLAACDFVGKLRLMIMFSGLYNIYICVVSAYIFMSRPF